MAGMAAVETCMSGIQSLASRTRCGLPALAAFPLVLFAMAEPASAQGQFDARYTLSMAGIIVGKIAWKAEINATGYSAAAAGRATGILSVLLSGEGNVSVKGALKDGRLQSAHYVSAVTREHERTAVSMSLDDGKVRELKVEEPPPESDRVPLTDAHRQNIVDPLSAFLIPGDTGDPMTAAACHRALPILDGRRRYDLVLSFRRIDKVKADQGYAGPALVCAMRFTAIAGHRTSSPLVKYLSEGRDIEVWFVPIAGTRFLAPFRLAVASVLGNMVLQADQFESGPLTSGKM